MPWLSGHNGGLSTGDTSSAVQPLSQAMYGVPTASPSKISDLHNPYPYPHLHPHNNTLLESCLQSLDNPPINTSHFTIKKHRLLPIYPRAGHQQLISTAYLDVRKLFKSLCLYSRSAMPQEEQWASWYGISMHGTLRQKGKYGTPDPCF
jgi:hypothetical protein